MRSLLAAKGSDHVHDVGRVVFGALWQPVFFEVLQAADYSAQHETRVDASYSAELDVCVWTISNHDSPRALWQFVLFFDKIHCKWIRLAN